MEFPIKYCTKTKSMRPTILLLVVGLFAHTILINSVLSEPLLEGPNVCNKTVTIERDVRIETPVEYEVKTEALCGLFRCTKSRKEIRRDEKIATKRERQLKPTCCPGYAETPDRQCAPICLSPCQNGKCVAPGICKCHPEPVDSTPGFVGPTCGRFTCLSPNKWGTKCDRDCNCTSSNAYCSASTGKCHCYPGWRGADCLSECDPKIEDCNDFVLPPIIEPDVNVLDSGHEARSASLVLAPSSLVHSESDETQSGRYFNLTTDCLLPLLMVFSLVLLILLFFLNKRYKTVKNELYYAACSTRGGSSAASGSVSGSNYSDQASYYSTSTTGRSPAALGPNQGDDFFGKNLNFATATRNILTGFGGDSKSSPTANRLEKNRSQFIVHPRVESHLITSQRSATQNIYSDLEKSSQCLYDSPTKGQEVELSSPDESNGHIYQVPRSLSFEAQNSGIVRGSKSSENDGSVEENIYEELKPNTPKRS